MLLIGPRCRRALLLSLIFLTPLVMLHRITWDAYNLPKLALFTSGLAIVGAIKGIELALGASVTPTLRRLAFPVAALTVPLLIAWAASPYREWAAIGAYGRYQGLIPYLLFAAFGLLVLDSFDGRMHEPAWALLVAGGLAATYSVIQTLGADPFVYDELGRDPRTGLFYAQSTLGNSNFAGGFFAMLGPIGLGVVATRTGRRDVAITLTALVSLACFVSFSQGAWAAFAGGMILAAGFHWPRERSWVKWLSLSSASLIALFLVSSVVVVGARWESGDPWTTTLSRAWKWEAALDMAASSPIVGRGPNSFAVEGFGHRPAEEAATRPEVSADDPHSVPLSFLTAAGALGLLGFLMFAGFGLSKGYHAATATPLSAGFLGGFVAYLLQGLVSIDEPTLRMAMWICLAGLVGTVAGPGTERGIPRRWFVLPVVVTMVILAVGVSIGAALIVGADIDMRRGNSLALDNRAAEARAAFVSALAVRSDNRYLYIYGTRIGELGTRRGPTGAPYIEDMRAAFRYLDHFADIRGLISKARLLHAWGEKADPSAYREALATYEQARDLDPFNPLLAVEEADVLLALGREQEALEELVPFEASDPPFAPYWGGLALVRARLGDLAGAAVAVDHAESLQPNEYRTGLAIEILESSD